MKALIFFSLLICLGLSGCDEKNLAGLNVTGKVGEILVVCDDAIWQAPLKNELDTALTQFIMPYWPDVPTFELVHRNAKTFEGAIKRHRNVLFLTLDKAHGDLNASIVSRRDVWANRQLVVEITAKDIEQLYNTCRDGLQEVHNSFDQAEWNRIRKYFREKQSPYVNDKIAENFGIHIELPDGANIVATQPNFYRVKLPNASRPIEFIGSGQQDVGAIYSGVMIYQYPYIDSSQMTLENLLKARDTMLKYNVPHETSRLYMGTQYTDLVYPESTNNINFDGSISGVEMRGMFVFKGKAIHTTGGAFWSFHFVHPKTNKLLCVSGYVDAPSTTSWTHSLREIEAIWKSVTIK
tara:strand:+ start:6437 stop:7489 length:1053 start_codon:yes stop_codon:yes gene_type:complete